MTNWKTAHPEHEPWIPRLAEFITQQQSLDAVVLDKDASKIAFGFNTHVDQEKFNQFLKETLANVEKKMEHSSERLVLRRRYDADVQKRRSRYGLRSYL